MPANTFAKPNDPRVRLALEAHPMSYLVALHNANAPKQEAVKKFSTVKAAASKIITVLNDYPNLINLKALAEASLEIFKEDTPMATASPDATPSNPLAQKLAAAAAASKGKLNPANLAESAAAIAREAKEKSAATEAEKAAAKAAKADAIAAKKAEADAKREEAKAAKAAKLAELEGAKAAKAEAKAAAKAEAKAAAKAAKAEARAEAKAKAKLAELTPEQIAEMEATKAKVLELREAIEADKADMAAIQEQLKSRIAELKTLAPKLRVKGAGGGTKNIGFVRGSFAYEGTDVITLLVDKNPKRNGAAVRFAVYATGMTVAQALAGGVTRGDVTWDVGKGFINIAPAQ